MSRRIDWHDDPAAPEVTSIVPSATCYVEDGDGAVLLIERTDNGRWSMPGGAMDPGETLTGCAVRETKEEAGVDVEVVDLVGIWTSPGHRIEYTSDGEVRQEFTVVYRARYVAGDLTPSSESRRVQWVDRGAVEQLPMDRSQRERIAWALSGQPPRLDPA